MVLIQNGSRGGLRLVRVGFKIGILSEIELDLI